MLFAKKPAIKRWMEKVRKDNRFVVDDPIPNTWLAEEGLGGEPLTLRSLLTRHGTVDFEIDDDINFD